MPNQKYRMNNNTFFLNNTCLRSKALLVTLRVISSVEIVYKFSLKWLKYLKIIILNMIVLTLTLFNVIKCDDN